MICLDILVIGAIISQWWASEFFVVAKNDNSKAALFGDSFGAVNALVSAFVFVGVIVAFILQRYELASAKKRTKSTKG